MSSGLSSYSVQRVTVSLSGLSSAGLLLMFPERNRWKEQHHKLIFKNGHEQNGLKHRRSLEVLVEQDSEFAQLNYQSFGTIGDPDKSGYSNSEVCEVFMLDPKWAFSFEMLCKCSIQGEILYPKDPKEKCKFLKNLLLNPHFL